LRPPFSDTSKLGFGEIFSDHMFLLKYSDEKGWHGEGIKKYGPFVMDPASCVLHYAQEIFEGLKAYSAPDGRILLFRPEENARRMNRSAARLCMPQIPEELFVKAIADLVNIDQEWVPKATGTSLYIRPTMIGTEPFLGVRPSKEYYFFIILSPVGAYYKEGFNPVGIYVEEAMVRSTKGGVGDVKTGGNYAASLLAGEKAKKKGFAQVLYLDADEHLFIEEVGSMNVFFVYGKKLITPPLGGSILPGITRQSVITLAPEFGCEVEERRLTIDEVLSDIETGKLTEMFGTGTAAVISPVGYLNYRDKEYIINDNKVGKITKSIYERLINIQYGRVDDVYGWTREACRIK